MHQPSAMGSDSAVAGRSMAGILDGATHVLHPRRDATVSRALGYCSRECIRFLQDVHAFDRRDLSPGLQGERDAATSRDLSS